MIVMVSHMDAVLDMALCRVETQKEDTFTHTGMLMSSEKADAPGLIIGQ